jgi:DNA-directed RNA polymerase specialized sigma24 family protein
MPIKKIYAVLTGDLVGYSRYKTKDRKEVLLHLKDSFKKIPLDITASKFWIFRGDSFQGILSRPEEALKAALIIRSSLVSRYKGKRSRLDARIAIGIGTVDNLPRRVGEGDGEAFRNSGMELDGMKKSEKNLIIKTPWKERNDELSTECALLDAVIERWTKEQAEAVMYQIMDLTQEEIARILKISQPAVFHRLRTCGSRAVQEFLKRYKDAIKYNVGDL